MSNNTLDDAGLWWKSRHSEIQDFEVPEVPPASFVNLDDDVDEIAEEKIKVTNQEVRTELNMIRLNEPTAEIITSVMNALVPVLFALFLKDIDNDKLQLSEQEHETITQAWAQYLKDSNVQMSPGVVLLGTIALIYGSKVTMVLTDRKREREANEQFLQLSKQNDALMKEIEELKKKKDAA